MSEETQAVDGPEGDAVIPDYCSVIDWVTFQSESLVGALRRLSHWIDQNRIDSDLCRTIEVDFDEDEGVYRVSICGGFVGDATIEDLRGADNEKEK